MAAGFFQSSLLVSAAPTSLLPACGACGLYRSCASPKIPVYGKGRRKVLIVGEAPGKTEDRQNKPFVGEAGQLLRESLERIGVDLRRDCWTTNAIICRPSDEDGENRKPTKNEIKYCRPSLLRVIRDCKPRTIILLGGIAVASLIGEIWREDPGAITRWVGWTIPCQTLNSWICPTYHPSYCLRNDDAVLKTCFEKHLKTAFALEGRPWEEQPNFELKVDTILDSEEAANQLRLMIAFNPKKGVAFDYETNMLKPDDGRARIICCSVSDGKTTIAYPWHGAAIKETGILLRSSIPKIAANLKFEDRWTQKEFGHGVTNWAWDTMVAAHVLDNRTGVTGLKFQVFVNLGVDSYDDHIKPLLRGGSGGVNQAVEEIELEQLLTYCGNDSLLEWRLAQRQMKQMEVSDAPA